ncbi:dihydrofolate reductase family protein [Nonomuraea purpurea]|uniref:Dihydrofolate reductase family protein n=1 Tax=Nonomuraea purpurea TaxID=1849276 RepID=A0ABV8GA63_9ACTN
MSKTFATLGMSLNGFIAGPNSRPDNPLGDGGTRIHEWVYGVEAWRARQNVNGGRTNQDDDIVRENFTRAGAYIMGRHMFAEGEVGWSDPPPFRAPVFVLTHTPRDPWIRQGGTTFTFVTEGIDTALALARQVSQDKDVQISGGADTVRQFFNAGLLDELQIHLAPLVLGAGVRLFAGSSSGQQMSTRMDRTVGGRPGRVGRQERTWRCFSRSRCQRRTVSGRTRSRSRRRTSRGNDVRSAARKARSSGANLTLVPAPSCRSRTVIW